MTVRITQLDGPLPNLALMRLAGWHRWRGDDVRFTRSPYRHLDEPAYDRVYGSAIFNYTRGRIDRLRMEFPNAIIGGTASGDDITVESLIGNEPAPLDYSIYPGFTASLGFTQRGCRFKCGFCVVPKKEGAVKSAATIEEIWRGDPHPRTIHLLDNDFFGQPKHEWKARLAEIRDGGFRVCFNQGINVRVITDEICAELATVEYRDDNFKRRRIYTAWDNVGDEGLFFRGVDRLERAGIPPHHVMVYMLIGYDPAETWERIHYRFQRMVDRGLQPYPMPFDQQNREHKRFQRWVLRKQYEMRPFEEYNTRRKRPDPHTADLFGEGKL